MRALIGNDLDQSPQTADHFSALTLPLWLLYVITYSYTYCTLYTTFNSFPASYLQRHSQFLLYTHPVIRYEHIHTQNKPRALTTSARRSPRIFLSTQGPK